MDKSKLGLTENKKLILIVMGSLGSEIITKKMKKQLQLFNNKEYEVLFITGYDYYEEFKDLSLASNIKIVPYIEGLSSLLKNATLIVSRAGATIISEIIALKIPTIFIPSPYVVNNHQVRNALELVNKKAALMINEKELEGDLLVREIDELLQDTKKYQQMKDNLEKLMIKDSATKIYDLAKTVIDRSN